MEIIRIISNVFFELSIFLNAALFVPQAVRIFYRQSAKGLSLVTFSGYNLIQVLMALHGYFHHDFVLMIGMLLSLITCGAVTMGIFWFGKVR